MSALRTGLVILLAGAISVGVAVIGQRWIDEPPPRTSASRSGVAPLEVLPEFGLTDLHGNAVSSAGWHGKVVVVNYWASWCPPCVREMPLFTETQAALGDTQVQVVGIAVDRREDVEQFVAKYPVNYPILLANAEAVALSKRLGNRVEGLPFTVIFDRRGRRVFSRTGEVTAAEIKAELDALVTAPRADRAAKDAS